MDERPSWECPSCCDCECARSEIAKRDAEIERLHAENTNLRAAMDSIRAIVLAAREIERSNTQ